MANDRWDFRLVMAPVVVAAMLIGGGLVFNWLINRPLHVRIPPHRSARPNAFDCYMPARTDPKVDLRACDWRYALNWAASRHPQAKPQPVPAGQAAPGAPIIVAPQPIKMREVPAQAGVAYYDEYALASLAEKQAMLRGYSPRLSRARRGFRYRCVVPRRGDDEWYFLEFYRLCTLLILDGQVRELRDDWDAALGAYLDSLRAGADLACGGTYFEAGWSGRQQQVAVSNAECCVQRVSASSARAGARRIAAILREQPSYADVLLETKYSEEAWHLRVLARPDWRQQFAEVFDNLGVHEKPRMAKLRVQTISRTAMMSRCEYWMDLRIAEARKPFALDNTPEGIKGDNFFQYFTTSYEPRGTERRKDWECARALDGLLELALALRAWKLERGSYPSSLQQLVPGYLDRLPSDPFGTRGTFRYKLKRTQYLLYSLGPDGRDSAGRALKDIWDCRPIGDIVWGVTDAQPPLTQSLVTRRPVRPIPSNIIEWKSKWDDTISSATTTPGATP